MGWLTSEVEHVAIRISDGEISLAIGAITRCRDHFRLCCETLLEQSIDLVGKETDIRGPHRLPDILTRLVDQVDENRVLHEPNYIAGVKVLIEAENVDVEA